MDNGTQQKSSRSRVVIAGGGVAAVEAMLALRDLAGEGKNLKIKLRRKETKSKKQKKKKKIHKKTHKTTNPQ